MIHLCRYLSHTKMKEIIFAPVAQLDRVLASEAKGRMFESSRAHQVIPQ